MWLETPTTLPWSPNHPAVNQAERLVQVGGDRAGQHHPVAGGLLDPEPDELEEAALELGVVRGGWGGHGLLPVGPGRRRASARSRWITVRVRSLRVRSMIALATSVERRRLPVIASG